MIQNFFIPTKQNKYKPHLLSKIAVISYSFILVFVNSFGGLIGLQEAQASTITAGNIVSLTNQERLSMGLNGLEINPQLSAAALAKANNMFQEQYWDHFGPNGESPWQFIRAAGYEYVYAGENLAKGFRTAEGVHEAWMASPTHKANIVSGNYKEIGVAVVEGNLLGSQTILVVQMFGNLTNEVYSANSNTEPAPTTPTPAPEKQVTVNKEVGQIKSISITSPKDGVVLTTPSATVKGDTTNVSGTYSVEIYDGENLIGDTTTNSPVWEFNKKGDWSEGEHRIQASLKGEDVDSNVVTFTVDSKAPTANLESLRVIGKDGKYKATFTVTKDFESLSLVLGSEIVEPQYTKDGDIVTMEIEGISDSVILVLSDEHGNTSEVDVSEYFVDQDEKKSFFPTIVLNTGDKISIGIVSFVLVLLIIEIAVYWRRGNIKDILSDIFTIGVWWLILTMAIFNGFSGIIN